MAIKDYSATRDSNASIVPGNIRSDDYRRDQQLINSIRQLMADLAVPAFKGPIDIYDGSGNLVIRLSQDSNGAIEIGRVDGTASSPYVDFHSGATAVDFDARIVASGGTGSSGGGKLEIHANAGLSLVHGRLEFPSTQNASTNVNTLDDYEEGTWTPVLAFSGGSTGITYSTQTGSYIKVGKLVRVGFNIILTSKGSSTGVAQITGLPFTVGSAAGDGPDYVAGRANNMAALSSSIVARAGASSTSTTLRHTNATGTVDLTDANFTNTSDITLTATYDASS